MTTRMEARGIGLAVLCAAGLCGCSTRRTPVKPVVTFVAPARPIMPSQTQAELEAPPEIAVAVLPGPPQFEPGPGTPPRPKAAAPATQEPSGQEKHMVPTIAPEITSEEMRAAKEETQHSLDLAEKNLLMAQGRQLNAMQLDLVSKVRGFADNAREAMRSGDWVKAKNFSNKAQVLSEQLASSL